jgi:hypothetical protein
MRFAKLPLPSLPATNAERLRKGAQATRQSSFHRVRCPMDCFAAPVIGRRFAPTRWLAMTELRVRAWLGLNAEAA